MQSKCHIVGNKAKGQISKWVFQESKARQNFRKTDMSYISLRTCAYQGVRNVCFSEILACFAFLNTRFESRPFALIPTIKFMKVTSNSIQHNAKSAERQKASSPKESVEM